MDALNRKSRRPRRATVLLMVVSLLALLFVIVTGFLSLARVNRTVVVDVTKADFTNAICEQTESWAAALIRDQVVDDQGRVLGGGGPSSYSYEDIPGYRSSNYLAALEPVWNPAPSIPPSLRSGSWAVLGQLCWPAVTSLDAGVLSPLPFFLYQLMRDYTYSDYATGDFTRADVEWNARIPFMDADGDGVPDSSFLLCGPATEAANGLIGASLSLPRISDPNALMTWRLPAAGDATTLNDEKWQSYDQQARYEVAVRVVSHGGMVTLDSPTLYSSNYSVATVPFNRDFVIDLFDATRNVQDTAMRRQYRNGTTDQNRLFDDLHANAGEVDSALRRRFILPVPSQSEGRNQRASRSVPVLAELLGESTTGHDGFPATLVPGFQTRISMNSGVTGERINIADPQTGEDNQRSGWAHAASFNATEYDRTGVGNQYNQVSVPYARRQFVTTINNSDELARKQDPNDPQPTAAMALDLGVPGKRGATYEGELKFYLGEVTKAFDVVSSGTGYQYHYNAARGSVIIQRLARLYYDMLAGHSRLGGTSTDDWGDLANTSAGSREVVSRRQQAFMLAVNTVAFAAPRYTDSTTAWHNWIDLVSYSDGGTVTYAGYAPQPFFTEVISYKPGQPLENPGDDQGPAPPRPGVAGLALDDPNDPNDTEIAIAIEIYNPNDPFYNGGVGDPNDVFALNLAQFLITVDEAQDPNDVLDLGSLQSFLNGREFAAFAIKDHDGNDKFDAAVGNKVETIALKSEENVGNDQLHFNLVRLGHDGRQAVVDRIQITRPPNSSWRCRVRDASPARYYNYGNYDADPGDVEYARWNMVAAWETTCSGTATDGIPPTASLGNAKMLLRGVVRDPDVLATNSRFAPTIPLVTMNAAPYVDLPMFKAWGDSTASDFRPRSFPTVGFMLFIPRYAHATREGDTGKDYHPMSRTLRRQWIKRNYRDLRSTIGAGAVPLHPTEYPADFGHMPIFDNTQSAVNNTYLAGVTKDPTTGTVQGLPWGLLVFDYFTTLNPQRDLNADGQPDLDPLEVPGRININTAPWYVLANLPLLGPFDSTNPDGPVTGQLPIRATNNYSVASSADPSPSFWDPILGVLVGTGYDPLDPSGTPTANPRLLATDPTYLPTGTTPTVPWQVDTNGRYRLGPWLAQSAAGYRDGVQYVADVGATNYRWIADSQLRSGAGQYIAATGLSTMLAYRAATIPQVIPVQALYGTIRGALSSDPDLTRADQPSQFGFVTVGELANVKGFDSATHVQLVNPALDATDAYTTFAATPLANGDFVKAVSLLALLDSQYLTTRSNTFTVYASVIDRQDPQRSVRLQTTVDRTDVLPRLTYAFYDPTPPGTYYALSNLDNPAIASLPLVPWLLDTRDATGNPGTDGVPETPVRTNNAGAEPEVVASEQVGYFNTAYDD